LNPASDTSSTSDRSSPAAPSEPARLELRITSEPEQISAVRRAVESLCCDERLGDQIACEMGLCVNEALANVIRHAYGKQPGKPIAVSAACDDQSIEVRIQDWGNGVNPATLPPRPYDPLEPGGLGLICMQRCMNEVRYEPQPDGMLLVLKRIKGPGEHVSAPRAGGKCCEVPPAGDQRSGR